MKNIHLNMAPCGESGKDRKCLDGVLSSRTFDVGPAWLLPPALQTCSGHCLAARMLSSPDQRWPRAPTYHCSGEDTARSR